MNISRLALCVALSAGWAPAGARPGAVGAGGLSDLLKAQTQQFSDAGITGDAKVFAKLLDPNVVFVNEDGSTATRQDLVAGAKPRPGRQSIQVTDWTLKRSGDVAVAKFVDVLTQEFGKQKLVFHYNSVEVWARRPAGWRMIASQTMVVPTDPPAIALPAAMLDGYVGTYEANAATRVQISRAGDGLVSSTNGGTAAPLNAEWRDVLFTPGAAPGLRLFRRDGAGRVIGYIARRNGNDVLFRKVD